VYDANIPIGGTIKAKVVPYACCCDNPNIKTNAGMMITPPAKPTTPLNIPAIRLSEIKLLLA